jgi:hypothetical protein
MENQIQDQAVAETNKPNIAMEQMQEKQQQPQVLELVADRILQMEFRPTAHLAKGYVMGIHVAASMGIYDLVQVRQSAKKEITWEFNGMGQYR